MGAPDPPALIDWLDRPGPARRIATAAGALFPSDLVAATSLGATAGALDGRCVVVMAGDPLKTAAALIDLDGRARRLVLCPPDLEPRHWAAVIRDAGADALVHDGDAPPPAGTGLALLAPCSLSLTRARPRPGGGSRPNGCCSPPAPPAAEDRGAYAGEPDRPRSTTVSPVADCHLEHVLRHPPLRRPADPAARAAWRRLDGAVAGRASRWPLSRPAARNRRHAYLGHAVALAPRADEPRRRGAFSPRYVRLSGEIADQAILNELRAPFPTRAIAHAFASTEAGVAFDVATACAGFPAASLDAAARGAVRHEGRGGLAADPLERAPPRAISADAPPLARCRWLCRYRRHARAARRPLPFRRPPRGHHQCRRRRKCIRRRSRR